MSTVLQQLASYRKNDWNVGQKQIEEVRKQLERLDNVAGLIKRSEWRYQNAIEEATGFAGTNFPQLKAKYQKQAAISKAAAIRLRIYFNNLLNEMSL